MKARRKLPFCSNASHSCLSICLKNDAHCDIIVWSDNLPGLLWSWGMGHVTQNFDL